MESRTAKAISVRRIRFRFFIMGIGVTRSSLRNRATPSDHSAGIQAGLSADDWRLMAADSFSDGWFATGAEPLRVRRGRFSVLHSQYTTAGIDTKMTIQTRNLRLRLRNAPPVPAAETGQNSLRPTVPVVLLSSHAQMLMRLDTARFMNHHVFSCQSSAHLPPGFRPGSCQTRTCGLSGFAARCL
jgi:hypothetical protein